MYKTVRHGENSLQYKILAQQEDGIANVKCRRSSRGKTAGIITVFLLLVCGVIATAVLVPLLLTDDFINLTGTFQKFSVSTLRRSHSGNHVVVIAKKPHGWNASRQSVLQTSVKSPNSTLNHGANNKTKETTIAGEPPPTNDTLGVFTTTKPPDPVTAIRRSTQKEEITETTTSATTTTITPTPVERSDTNINIQRESDFLKFSPTAVPFQQQGKSKGLVPILHTNEQYYAQEATSTSQPPSWYENHKWNFETPASFISWLKNRLRNNPLSTVLAGFCTVTFIVIIILIIMRSLPDRRKLIQKESAESKEDKTRLLKPSARTSDEE